MFDAITFNTKNWKLDTWIGLGVGILFILLNILAPAISIGLPNLGLSVSDTGTIIVIGILAPIIEEIFFRGALLGLLLSYGINYFFSIILAALGFMLYHYTAYGGSISSASGAFIGAFIFAILATILALWRKSLLPGIIVHSLFNIYLLAKLSIVVG